MSTPHYFLYQGEIARTDPQPDGAVLVEKSPKYNMADFMMYGQEISKAEYYKYQAKLPRIN